MTVHERMHHEVINGSRRKRISRGSGTSAQEVQQSAAAVCPDAQNV
jgi:signal recognition particle subunit SRP54